MFLHRSRAEQASCNHLPHTRKKLSVYLASRSHGFQREHVGHDHGVRAPPRRQHVPCRPQPG
uniref:Uncharacterized protein n=1 Tax=Aegilops tauschii subsp. strangulata TaxID=200361 RepID=A0A453LZ91_AEGTS